MKPTLYEVETTLRKACVGAGLPFGLAEDCGQAAAWMTVQGHDGALAVLQSIRAGLVKVDGEISANDQLTFSASRIAVCGPSAMDFLLSGEVKAVHLKKVDSPLLLVGLAGVAAGLHDRVFSLSFSNKTTAIVAAQSVEITGDLPREGCDIMISSSRTAKQALNLADIIPELNIDDLIWAEAMKLAAKTYVPESRASRAGGAGAGLTDND